MQIVSHDAAEKPQIRKSAMVARRQVHGHVDIAQATRALIDYIDRVPAIDIVSAYLPIRTEIDPLPAMNVLDAAGVRVCVPVIQGHGRPLRFRHWTPDCTLEEGPFGAPVPESGDWLEPELLITPLLAFDNWGHRLGYGGGFYDRTLAELRARRRTYAIGFAYEAQNVAQVPTEDTDQRLDAVVTECRVLFPL